MPLLAHCCSQPFATGNYLSFPIATMGSLRTNRTKTPVAGEQRWDRRVTAGVSSPQLEALSALTWTCSSRCKMRARSEFTHFSSLLNLRCIFLLCFSSKRSRSMSRRWRRCSRPWFSCRQRVRNGSSWSTGCGPGWRENWSLSACSRYPLVPSALLGFPYPTPRAKDGQRAFPSSSVLLVRESWIFEVNCQENCSSPAHVLPACVQNHFDFQVMFIPQLPPLCRNGCLNLTCIFVLI